MLTESKIVAFTVTIEYFKDKLLGKAISVRLLLISMCVMMHLMY